MNIKQIIIDFFYPGLLDSVDQYKNQVAYYKNQLSGVLKSENIDKYTLQQKIIEIEVELKKLEKVNDELYCDLIDAKNTIAELNKPKLSPIDEFCSKNYKVIANKVYKQKRKFKNKEIQVFLNQLITPDAFEVQRIKKNLDLDTSLINQIAEITTKIAKITTWTSDDTTNNQSDFYYYPEETLVLKEADCEDIANVITSFLHNEIGTGYGFYSAKGYSENDKGFGHAFNVFEWNDCIYISEGTGDNAIIHQYEPNNPKEQYHLLYVITQEYTYKCTDENTEFGYLVNW